MVEMDAVQRWIEARAAAKLGAVGRQYYAHEMGDGWPPAEEKSRTLARLLRRTRHKCPPAGYSGIPDPGTNGAPPIPDPPADGPTSGSAARRSPVDEAGDHVTDACYYRIAANPIADF